jgi:putative transposase
MSKRIYPLVNGFYYHIFNRSVERRTIFISIRDYKRALQILNYYRFPDLPVKYSVFEKFGVDKRKEFLENLEEKNNTKVDIIAYCVMPNHYHLILKQNKDGGISKFIGDFQNSYAKYFNIKYKREGVLFGSNFKSVLIENERQLLHLSRYIHLNPYSSGYLSSLDKLINYSWSSFSHYLGESQKGMLQNSIVISQFKSRDSYKEFVLNHADYERKIKQIEHLIIE